MNIITIDADRAAEEIQSHMEDIYICDDVALKPIKAILQGCAVPVPESAKDVVKKIQQILKHYNGAAEEIRQIWKSYRSDCKPVYDAGWVAVRDNEIAALIQAYVDAQVADLKAEIEDLKKYCADLKAQNENLKKYCAIYK